MIDVDLILDDGNVTSGELFHGSRHFLYQLSLISITAVSFEESRSVNREEKQKQVDGLNTILCLDVCFTSHGYSPVVATSRTDASAYLKLP